MRGPIDGRARRRNGAHTLSGFPVTEVRLCTLDHVRRTISWRPKGYMDRMECAMRSSAASVPPVLIVGDALVDGHHRLEVARLLGMTSLRAHVFASYADMSKHVGVDAERRRKQLGAAQYWLRKHTDGTARLKPAQRKSYENMLREAEEQTDGS
jgi:hypothetical protein